MSYHKIKIFIKKFYKKCRVGTSSRPVCVCKKLITTSIAKLSKLSKIAKLSEYVKVSCTVPQIPFYRGILNIKKDLKIVFMSHFLYSIKIFHL